MGRNRDQIWFSLIAATRHRTKKNRAVNSLNVQANLPTSGTKLMDAIMIDHFAIVNPYQRLIPDKWFTYRTATDFLVFFAKDLTETDCTDSQIHPFADLCIFMLKHCPQKVIHAFINNDNIRTSGLTALIGRLIGHWFGGMCTCMKILILIIKY